MRKHLVWTVTVLVFWACALLAAAQPPGAPSPYTAAEIRERLQRALANSSYEEAMDKVTEYLKADPAGAGAIAAEANDAFTWQLNELNRSEAPFLTSEEACSRLDAKLDRIRDALEIPEVKAFRLKGFNYSAHLDGVQSLKAKVCAARLRFLDRSSQSIDEKFGLLHKWSEDLRRPYLADESLQMPAAVAEADAVLQAFVRAYDGRILDKAQSIPLIEQARAQCANSPGWLAILASLEAQVRLVTGGSASPSESVTPSPPSGAPEGSLPEPLDRATSVLKKEASPWLSQAQDFAMEHLGAILALAGLFIVLWGLPVFLMNRGIARGNMAASLHKPWVVWFGIAGYCAHLLSGKPGSGQRKEAKPRERRLDDSGKGGKDTGGIPCVFCKKPLDRIADYGSLRFDECPHCHGSIEPLFEPENYLNYLVDQLEASAKKRKKGKRPAELADSQAMTTLLQALFDVAMRRRATDIHVERDEHGAHARFRIDGMLTDAVRIPVVAANAFLSAIKVQANLDITNHTTPQDGRYQTRADGVDIDIRISCSPSSQGEILFMRLLDKRRVLIKPSALGFEGENLGHFEDAIHKPHGLILVTGPTGSGKSTTLYVAMAQINTGERNILTIEDPVEYQMEGLKQMQVNPDKNFTFATGLRSILRQDPDVIMVGEIRDEETANMAVDAAITGHLVFSTLHTMDTISAISRLSDLGIQPKRYSSALELIIAQRLVRLICPQCKQAHQPDDRQLEILGIQRYKSSIKFMAGAGCNHCNYTGYYGRKAILEVFRPDDDIRARIEANASVQSLREMGRTKGMKTLREEGIRRIIAGQTTVEEIIRITDESSRGATRS